MNAAASSLIEAIKASFGGVPTGTDWDYIPSGATSWYKYGSGGINSWGSLCGVPNGCIAVLNLMNLNTATFVDQIMYYYCQTEFPVRGLHDLYLSDPDPSSWAREPMPDDDVLAYTVANSPLCHASVSKWAYAAGVDMSAPGTTAGTAHKTDRCAKVAAAGAAFTAELLNGAISNLTMPYLTASCYSCHQTHLTSGGAGPAQQGKMDCRECHTDFKPHRALSLVIEDVWTADGSGNSKSTFTAGDPIQCKVQFSILGSGSCFMKTYQSRVAGTCGKILGLPKNETLSTGTYEWTWSGTVPGGCTGAAKVIMDLKMFDFQGGPLHAESKKIHKFTIT
jgi:predicted CXXCH cytochrome family protein